MTEVYNYPVEWYRFTQLSFQLRSASQISSRPWTGGNSSYGPLAQMFMPKLTVSNKTADIWKPMDAFFSRLGGQAGLLRIGDPSRQTPRYNATVKASVEMFSDGSSFSDGTGFVAGLLPSTCYLGAAAAKGDKYAVLAGLPASVSRAIRRGDLFEIRPNGSASICPNLYQVMVDGSTDASGNVGVEIRPALRMDFAEGDMVVLDAPTSVFHLVDDTQAEMTITAPTLANLSFSLLEAIENVGAAVNGWGEVTPATLTSLSATTHALESDVGMDILADVGKPILVQ